VVGGYRSEPTPRHATLPRLNLSYQLLFLRGHVCRISSSSLARQPYVGPGLPQKLLTDKVSDYCFFRFRDKSLFQGEVVSPTPISDITQVICYGEYSCFGARRRSASVDASYLPAPWSKKRAWGFCLLPTLVVTFRFGQYRTTVTDTLQEDVSPHAFLRSYSVTC
jgi:hypothetical protein